MHPKGASDLTQTQHWHYICKFHGFVAYKLLNFDETMHLHAHLITLCYMWRWMNVK